jgi:chemotaxis response regulator CheB
MPREAIKLGAADEVTPLPRVAYRVMHALADKMTAS